MQCITFVHVLPVLHVVRRQVQVSPAYRKISRARHVHLARMCVSPNPSDAEAVDDLKSATPLASTAVDIPEVEPTTPSLQIDTEGASRTLQALLDDVASHPDYYLNVAGVILGIILSVIVLSATMVSLDSIPLVPDVLRMIGLGYLFWFLSKFLFSSTERERLSVDIDQLVKGAQGKVRKVDTLREIDM